MKRLIGVLIFLGCALTGITQPGARVFCKKTDLLGCLDNPAAIAGLKSASIEVLASRPFMLNELSRYTAAAGFSLPGCKLVVAARYEGFGLSNTSGLSIGYGRAAGNKIAVGGRIGYTIERTHPSVQAISLRAEPAVIFSLSSQVRTGLEVALLRNFGAVYRGNTATAASFTLAYQPSEPFICSFTVQHSAQQAAQLKAAVSYEALSQFIFEFGIDGGTGWWSAVRFHLGPLHTGIRFASHPQLGFSPGFFLMAEKKTDVL